MNLERFDFLASPSSEAIERRLCMVLFLEYAHMQKLGEANFSDMLSYNRFPH